MKLLVLDSTMSCTGKFPRCTLVLAMKERQENLLKNLNYFGIAGLFEAIPDVPLKYPTFVLLGSGSSKQFQVVSFD